MTKYSIKNKNNLHIIEIKGHSGYSEEGSDIVCASISTAIYMTRNLIEVLEPSYNLSNIKLEEGYALFEVSSEYENAVKILGNLEFTLDDLANQYPNHIKRVI